MIETARLILRRWCDADTGPFYEMGQDAEVMRHLGPLMARAEAAAIVARVNAQIDADGHGFWAVERRADGAFLGFCGIQRGPAGTPIADLPEIGWRLARTAWGQGYAREAAQASLDWFWANTGARRVFAITTPGNTRSWGLMLRIGMARVADGDFDHPAVPLGDPLRPHITYAIARP